MDYLRFKDRTVYNTINRISLLGIEILRTPLLTVDTNIIKYVNVIENELSIVFC